MSFSATDPLALAEEVGKIVRSGEKRKYYRFRPAPYYGGIATADCVGCCLRCLFCWSWKMMTQPDRVGQFYAPEEVVQKLLSIARKKDFLHLRISGNEPTLHRSHLLRVLEQVPRDFQFILETNGILVGHDPSYAKDLSRFPNLYVRVSLKGASPENFAKLTGMKADGFSLQLKALEYLLAEGVDCFPALIADFSSPEEIEKLKGRLKEIRRDFADVEEEDLILYPFVLENLKKGGISYARSVVESGV